jgi:hypothetical protein
MEENEAAYPGDVLLLGSIAVVAHAHRIAYLVEQAHVMCHDA